MMSRVITLMFYQTALGSSPRVWGQVIGTLVGSASGGIIPTRVGTRPVADSGVMLSPNHPHAWGDKTLSSKSLKDCWGSSPRVWGQDGADRQERQEDRIIPTRVGTSIDDCAFSGCTGDHPHACGDKISP